ncbi:MAG: hypothetical protein AB1414_14305 [bacterium]
MKEVRTYTLASEIEEEVKKIRELFVENAMVCRMIEEGEEFDFLDSRGQSAIIHDIYTGLEKVFKKIANDLNGGIPPGEDWHYRLLHQMSLEIKGVRPAVVSKESYSLLKKLLAFRHLFRNIYGFELDKERVDELNITIQDKGDKIIKEIIDFANLLRRRGENEEGI